MTLKLRFNKKLQSLALMGAALSLTSFTSQANDFQLHPEYASFKQKTMQSYGLTAQQIDWYEWQS